MQARYYKKRQHHACRCKLGTTKRDNTMHACLQKREKKNDNKSSKNLPSTIGAEATASSTAISSTISSATIAISTPVRLSTTIVIVAGRVRKLAFILTVVPSSKAAAVIAPSAASATAASSVLTHTLEPGGRLLIIFLQQIV